MSPAAFTAALQTIGWSQRHLASLLECDHILPMRWASGRAQVPPRVARWLTTLATLHDRHAPPTDWRLLPRQ